MLEVELLEEEEEAEGTQMTGRTTALGQHPLLANRPSLPTRLASSTMSKGGGISRTYLHRDQTEKKEKKRNQSGNMKINRISGGRRWHAPLRHT
jgi:hypothetical protein